VTPLRFEPSFWCRACGSPASVKTCPHGPGARLELSGTKVRELLRSGANLPAEFSRPETVEILRAHYRGTPEAKPAPVRRGSGGFIVWLTGLSGAGKSTLAEALAEELVDELPVEVLDGDEVRTNLSRGLGFSREDRDTNIRRIGYVARLLARNGVAVLTAAISPYAATRDEMRRLAVEDGITFLEVFVEAELDVLIQRDVKGLYRKALAGEIAHFTGVSDPYEAPASPDVAVKSDRETVQESAARVLDALRERGLIGEARKERVA
jgi:adenylyl-sulfate kinase